MLQGLKQMFELELASTQQFASWVNLPEVRALQLDLCDVCWLANERKQAAASAASVPATRMHGHLCDEEDIADDVDSDGEDDNERQVDYAQVEKRIVRSSLSKNIPNRIDVRRALTFQHRTCHEREMLRQELP